MRENVEGLSIVLVGAWNPAIFSPAWIASGRLTHQQNIAVGFMFGPSPIIPEFSFDEIRLRVETSRLTIRVSTLRDESLIKLGEVASKILTDLPHTPISGVGINFQFIEPEPNPTILSIFDFSDNNLLSDNNWSIESTQVSRKIKLDETNFNYIATLAAGSVTFDINFHSDITNCDQARDKIAPGVPTFRTKTLSFLQSIYNLHL